MSPMLYRQSGSGSRRNLVGATLKLPVPHSLPGAVVSDPESAVVPMSLYLGIQVLIRWCDEICKMHCVHIQSHLRLNNVTFPSHSIPICISINFFWFSE